MLDIYEDDLTEKGKLFLIGKSFNKKLKTYVSVTIVVENLLREIYFVPKKDLENKTVKLFIMILHE